MSSAELCFLTIRQAGRLIRAGELSPVELTQAFLERIERMDGTLQVYVTVLADEALAEARRAEAEILAGEYRGPLHGVSIALKDLYDTRGVRTTACSRIMAQRVPERDATATARLRRAGAVLLGKLTMHEFAMGGPDPTCGFPLARNPWDLERMPGGSSSGSAAAVAAGLCMGSLGSCTGGSIRGPASYCGMVGLKPTYGRVSRYGVVPLSWTLDHCGPMTWTVEDAALMLQAVAGYDPMDPTTARAPVPDYSRSLVEDVRGLRVGVPRHYFFSDDPRIDGQVKEAVDRALSELAEMGAHVEEVRVPSLEYCEAAHPVVMLSEAYAYHRRRLAATPELYGRMARARLQAAALFTAADYVQAQRVRRAMKEDFARLLERVDVVASPTMAGLPPRFDEITVMTSPRSLRFPAPYNMTGLPAISIPCGFSREGLPIGLQIAGRPFDEGTVLRVAYAYQQAKGLYERRPPVG